MKNIGTNKQETSEKTLEKHQRNASETQQRQQRNTR